MTAGNVTMKNILVFLEQRNGIVKQASIEVWNGIQACAGSKPGNAKVFGIVAGPLEQGDLEGMLSGDGVVYHDASDDLALYNSENYITVISELFGKESCSTLLFADTALSRDLAPRLSIRLQAALLSGCEPEQALLKGICRRPVYSGRGIAVYSAQSDRTIYTLASTAGHPETLPEGKIVFKSYKKSCVTDLHPASIVRKVVMIQGRPDVAEARIIVAGGRGMGGRESFGVLEELAEVLGGAVGASRSVVDEGWRPHAEQIGQTGKTVAPALYIACGISGAVQHLAGIGAAGTVVAINNDPHAPIFTRADYGIVGDVHTVIPNLVGEFRDFLKKK